MRLILIALIGSVLLAGCGSSDGSSADSTIPSARVETRKLHDAPQIANAHAIGDALVAQNWVWGDEPYSWSDDKGRTWQSSTVPTHSRKLRERQTLIVVGQVVLATGRLKPTSPDPPSIWWSHDAGRTFHQASGVAEEGEAGGVAAVVESDGKLIAFGGTRPAGPPTKANLEAAGTVRWESGDRGKTWSRTPLRETPYVPTSVVVAPEGALIATPNAQWNSARPTDTAPFIRSTDGGHTWKSLPIPAPEPEGTAVAPTRIGDTIYLAAGSRTYSSSDGGANWTRLGPAPVMADSQGTDPKISTIRVATRSGGVLVARVDRFFNYDHYLAGLAFSDDDGAHWHAARLPATCTSNMASSNIKGVVRIRGLLVATWHCSGGGDRGGRLFTSSDDGRTWSVQRPGAIAGMDLSAPVKVGADQVSIWAGPNAEQAPKVLVTVSSSD